MAKKSMTTVTGASAVLAMMLCGPLYGQAGRDYVYVVGSSTVYPFSTVVAERFGRNSRFRTPKVESTGSGGGMKLFCDGIGVDYPDVASSSRAIKPSELDACKENGVRDIVEVKIGYDGIVVANATTALTMSLSRRDIFLALARRVPTGSPEELVPNTYVTWRDVNPVLPDVEIEVLGPPPTSGSRDAFVEQAMEVGCRTIPWIAALADVDHDVFHGICHTIREDGHFIEVGENDNLVVQKLQANPSALGIFGFSFLDQNADKVKGAAIDGVVPTFDSISDNSYPITRPLYLYVKKAHVDVIPGLRGFLREFGSERAWGDEGYLSDRGLIPMPMEERQSVAATVISLTPLTSAREH